MRTTLTIDDQLLAKARLLAAREHTTLSSVVEDALRRSLADSPRRPAERISLPDFGYSGGLRAGVDLYDHELIDDLVGGATAGLR